MLKCLGRWLGRNALLYAVLFAAILAAPVVGRYIYSEWSSGDIREDTLSAHEIARMARKEFGEAQAKLKARSESIRTLGGAELAAELERSKAAQVEASRLLQECGGWLDKFRPSRILECKRHEFEIEFRNHEAGAIESAQNAHKLKLKAKNLGNIKLEFVPSQLMIDQAKQKCNAAKFELEQFRNRWMFDRALRNMFDEEAKLTAKKNKICKDLTDLVDNKRAAEDANTRTKETIAKASEAARKAENWTAGTIQNVAETANSRTTGDALRLAALALLGIVVSPWLLRTLLFWVVAPLAERRGAIRLAVQGGSESSISPSPCSATSVAVRLHEDEELLIRDSYLQKRSLASRPRFRWLLSARYPLSSIASGMTFLTAIRGKGQDITVSATRDPFAEVTTLSLPEGAACVLQPRAIAALVQPIGRTIRIKSQWRLLTLNAYLTGQLRYLVFHGPARLIIKGARGVRVEQATQGRVFAQDQLVGFSADLAYSVTRTETFMPYLIGSESLLKDKVEAGNGILIVEEAPLANDGKSGGRRKGVEGVLDAVMKLFGI